MKRVRVHTASGSVYGLDLEKMTWERVNINVPRILGTDETFGPLRNIPAITLGERMMLHQPDGSFIQTTRVVHAEVLE